MIAKITSFSHIKITAASARVWCDVSVDTDEDGARDISVRCSGTCIPADISVPFDVGYGDITVTAAQAVALLKKIAAKAARKDAKAQCALGDTMPEEVAE